MVAGTLNLEPGACVHDPRAVLVLVLVEDPEKIGAQLLKDTSTAAFARDPWAFNEHIRPAHAHAFSLLVLNLVALRC